MSTARFINHYACPCGTTWQDQWDCACDDRCPDCNTSCSPHQSEEIEDAPPAAGPIDPRTLRIRQLNDEFRRTFTGGRIMLTQGITALPETTQRAVLHAIATFNAFDDGNDPWAERDFIPVEIEGLKIFGKVDYYDLDFIHGSEDPADPAKTIRVMTVMLAEEY